MGNEGRQSRARQIQFDLDIDYIGSDGDEVDPGLCVVLQTTTVKTYPTAAQSFYAVIAVEVTGPEVEGGPAGLVAGGNVFFAANVGNLIPPAGTNVMAWISDAGRWTFRY